MPSLPDIPGKRLVTGAGGAAKVAAGAGLAMIAVGGYVARRLLRRGVGGEEPASADPIAEPPTPPAVAAQDGGGVEVETPEPADAQSGSGGEQPASVEEQPDGEPSAETGQLPGSEQAPTPDPTGTDAPRVPEAEPGDISKHESPHHALNNPVGDPDPTEWPDPYEKRPDPRDPPDPDGQPFGAEPHSPTNAESTSEPHPSEDPEAGERTQPPERDNLDD